MRQMLLLWLSSFSSGASPRLALNGSTGEVTVASDLSDVTEDTLLELTAMAKDSGLPPLNSTGQGSSIASGLVFVSVFL